MAPREQAIIIDIVDAIRAVLIKHDVTFEEYRTGFFHLIKTGDSHEIPLLLDMFFNQTVCDIEMKTRKGSRANVEGPYFLEGVPLVTDAIKTRGNIDPMLIRCQVNDLDDNPVPDVLVDLWFADSDGNYSGYSDDFPIEYFRAKVKTDKDGKYSVMGSVPGEYSISPDRHGPGPPPATIGERPTDGGRNDRRPSTQ